MHAFWQTKYTHAHCTVHSDVFWREDLEHTRTHALHSEPCWVLLEHTEHGTAAFFVFSTPDRHTHHAQQTEVAFTCVRVVVVVVRVCVCVHMKPVRVRKLTLMSAFCSPFAFYLLRLCLLTEHDGPPRDKRRRHQGAASHTLVHQLDKHMCGNFLGLVGSSTRTPHGGASYGGCVVRADEQTKSNCPPLMNSWP